MQVFFIFDTLTNNPNYAQNHSNKRIIPDNNTVNIIYYNVPHSGVCLYA